jgi:hypothetical protein
MTMHMVLAQQVCWLHTLLRTRAPGPQKTWEYSLAVKTREPGTSAGMRLEAPRPIM